VFDPSSRSKLTARDLDRFPGESLFDHLARCVCRAECLPRKELYESWEVARRVRRVVRGGRVVDVGGGHGLLAHVMLLLDDSSPSAVVVDPKVPPSSAALHQALAATWTRLAGRVSFAACELEAFEIGAADVVVSSHGCGGLTDRILHRACEAGAVVAVLPCCHDVARSETAGLTGWVDGPLAVDLVRALRLRDRGYRTWAQTIPDAVTPKNRLLIGRPARSR
jgi:hypothetical protein